MNETLYHPFNKKIPLRVFEERGYKDPYAVAMKSTVIPDWVSFSYSWFTLVLASVGYSILIFILIKGRSKFKGFFYRFLIFDSLMEWGATAMNWLRIRYNLGNYFCAGGWICKQDVCGYRQCPNYFIAYLQVNFFGMSSAIPIAAVWCSIVIGVDRVLGAWFPIWYRANAPMKRPLSKVALFLLFTGIFAVALPIWPMYLEVQPEPGSDTLNVLVRSMSEYPIMGPLVASWLVYSRAMRLYVGSAEPVILLILWILILVKLIAQYRSASLHGDAKIERKAVVMGFLVVTMTTVYVTTENVTSGLNMWLMGSGNPLDNPEATVEDFERMIFRYKIVSNFIRATDFLSVVFALNFYVLFAFVASFRRKAIPVIRKSLGIAETTAVVPN